MRYKDCWNEMCDGEVSVAMQGREETDIFHSALTNPW